MMHGYEYPFLVAQAGNDRKAWYLPGETGPLPSRFFLPAPRSPSEEIIRQPVKYASLGHLVGSRGRNFGAIISSSFPLHFTPIQVTRTAVNCMRR